MQPIDCPNCYRTYDDNLNIKAILDYNQCMKCEKEEDDYQNYIDREIEAMRGKTNSHLY